MDSAQRDALRRILQAERVWTGEPRSFLLLHTGAMKRTIDHPGWDTSWAVPSEHTIDDLAELGFLRVEPTTGKNRSFVPTVAGRHEALNLERQLTAPAARGRAPSAVDVVSWLRRVEKEAPECFVLPGRLIDRAVSDGFIDTESRDALAKRILRLLSDGYLEGSVHGWDQATPEQELASVQDLALTMRGHMAVPASGPDQHEPSTADSRPNESTSRSVDDHVRVSLSGRTIARLAKPFEGGSGPSHSSIERIWIAEDASEYLPDEGNKAERVLVGLKALRDGRRAAHGLHDLPPDVEKLRRVACELAEMLVDAGLVAEDDVGEALGASGPSPPSSPASVSAEKPAAPAMTADEARDEESVVDSTAPIFVVHGHDRALLHEVVRVLERGTGREVIVLHEQPNAGRTILEKFEAHAATASYAVVLLTGDDTGGAVGGSAAPRGRQNVIFELGFFFGRLGRERVAVLLAPGVEQPSDIAGLVYIPVDSGGAWKYHLARELSAADIPVDRDRIP